MRYSARFSELVKKALAGRSLRQAGAVCGLHYTTIQGMAATGQIPLRETVRAFADGLGVTGRARRELFAAAGYIADFAPEPAEEVAA